MKQFEMFGNARWIGTGSSDVSACPVICKRFFVKGGERATIKLIGLATFELFINGKRVSDELFMPLNSAYQATEATKDLDMRYRVYANVYDITEYVSEGENTLAVILGYGWYTGVTIWDALFQRFGDRKLIYSIALTDTDGNQREIVSDGEEYFKASFIVGGHMHSGEIQDFTDWNNDTLSFSAALKWEKVVFAEPVDTEYFYSECPADKIREYLEPRLISKSGDVSLYDIGRNITGYPILISDPDESGEVTVRFSERLSKDTTELDSGHMHGQSFKAKTANTPCELYPRFTWYGFRYFTVEGSAAVKSVAVVHSDVQISSAFECSNEALNWIYKTFIDTQLANMHRGTPSDCPHIERLGYTGDGQLVCRTAFHTLDAERFYRKWIGDISDAQDRSNGRVPNTAPFMPVGGGPGGWGVAIVSVPYEFWKYYGDKSVLTDNFDGMLKYLDFMSEHSEYGLVTSDVPSAQWCLGEWCTPPDQSNLPAPFVNTCQFIIAINKVIEIAKALSKGEDTIAKLEKKRAVASKAVNLFYFNSMERDATYCANVRGAGAFAIRAGLGNRKTAEKLVDYYDRTRYYDTGIFGTEFVTRTLFELGRGDVAVKLLSADVPHGFGAWKKNGETTFPEYWNVARSHNHPMFGAVVACFFEFILGIKQEKDSSGYKGIVISPCNIEAIDYARGYITAPVGKISVSYKKNGERTEYEI